MQDQFELTLRQGWGSDSSRISAFNFFLDLLLALDLDGRGSFYAATTLFQTNDLENIPDSVVSRLLDRLGNESVMSHIGQWYAISFLSLIDPKRWVDHVRKVEQESHARNGEGLYTLCHCLYTLAHIGSDTSHLIDVIEAFARTGKFHIGVRSSVIALTHIGDRSAASRVISKIAATPNVSTCFRKEEIALRLRYLGVPSHEAVYQVMTEFFSFEERELGVRFFAPSGEFLSEFLRERGWDRVLSDQAKALEAMQSRIPLSAQKSKADEIRRYFRAAPNNPSLDSLLVGWLKDPREFRQPF